MVQTEWDCSVKTCIDSFSGEYEWLSNFYPCQVEFDGEVYPTVEHAYQAAKTLNPIERKMIGGAKTPGQAKKLAKKCSRRDHWEVMKIPVMRGLLEQKFNQLFFRKKLTETGGAILIEGNYWGDVFWGVCKGEGTNHLGRLLMDIREELHNRAFGQPHYGH